MKADLETAVGHPAVNLVLALDPHLALQPAAAVMNDGASASLAGLAMTDIDAVRLSRCYRPQLSAMTFRDPLHLVLPNVALRRFPILPLATGGVEPLGQSGNQHRNLVLVDELKELAAVEKCTPAQLALAWVLSRAPHIVPIPAPATVTGLKKMPPPCR